MVILNFLVEQFNLRNYGVSVLNICTFFQSFITSRCSKSCLNPWLLPRGRTKPGRAAIFCHAIDGKIFVVLSFWLFVCLYFRTNEFFWTYRISLFLHQNFGRQRFQTRYFILRLRYHIRCFLHYSDKSKDQYRY